MTNIAIGAHAPRAAPIWGAWGVAFAIGLCGACIVIAASAVELKWAIALSAAFCAILAFLPLPAKTDLSLFFLFMFMPIRLDYFPILFRSETFLPVKGFSLCLYDLPLAWLLAAGLHRRITERFAAAVGGYLQFFVPAAAVMAAGMLISGNPPIHAAAAAYMALKCMAIFFAIVTVIDRPGRLVIGVFALATAVGFEAVIGIVQRLSGGNPTGLSLIGEATEKQFSFAGFQILSRASGTFGSPNTLAMYFSSLLPVLLVMTAAAPIPRLLRWGFLAPMLALGLVTDGLTFSRAGWMSAGCGLALAIYFTLAYRTGRRVFSMVVAGSIIAASAGIFVASSPSVRNRISGYDQGSGQSRISLAKVCVAMVAANPLLGVGYGNFVTAAPRYDHTSDRISERFPYPVHNEYLLVAAELGLPALFLLIALALRAARDLRAGMHAFGAVTFSVATGLTCGLTAWGIHMLLEWINSFTQIFLWAYLGLICATGNLARAQARTP